MAGILHTILFLAVGLPGLVLSVDPYFWHITDLHFDPTYFTSQDSCNEALTTPGMFGDFECDAPYRLVTSAVQNMRNMGPTAKFVLYSGDTSPHPKDYSGFSTEYVQSLILNATALIRETFEDIPIVLAIGNHDYYLKDQLPAEENDIYDAMATVLEQSGTPAEEVERFRRGAFYTQLLENKLRVVVTNTNLYLETNNVTAGQADPGGQYAWLRSVLQNATDYSEWVHLVAHVPPGVMEATGSPKWLREVDNIKFNDIVREFSSVIVGFYSSHQHFDSFRLYYNNNDEPVAAMLLAPSVTPWRARIGGDNKGAAHNPGFRKISYDQADGVLTDYTQYYLDLNKANTDQEAEWKSLYTFRGLYGIYNITAPHLDQLVQDFSQYGSRDFHNYYDMNSVGAGELSNEPCSCDCFPF